MGASIIRTISGVADGSTEFTLLIDAWPSDVNIRWKWLAACNQDSRGSWTKLVLQRGRQEYCFTKTRQTNAAQSVQVALDVKAPGDFRAGAIFAGAASGDRVGVNVFGEIVD